jgi:hypothetical protein
MNSLFYTVNKLNKCGLNERASHTVSNLRCELATNDLKGHCIGREGPANDSSHRKVVPENIKLTLPPTGYVPGGAAVKLIVLSGSRRPGCRFFLPSLALVFSSRPTCWPKKRAKRSTTQVFGNPTGTFNFTQHHDIEHPIKWSKYQKRTVTPERFFADNKSTQSRLPSVLGKRERETAIIRLLRVVPSMCF